MQLDQHIRQGQWTTQVPPELYGVDVFGKTLGVVGMGRIGAAIAERAHLGFRMPILYHARRKHLDVDQKFSGTHLPIQDLLAQSDFVVNVLPSTPETQKYFNKDKFLMMKKSSIFINIGRGATVEEKDLIQALDSNHLLSAGLDVFEKEPLPLDSPLIQRPDVVLLPHIGSATHETRKAMDIMAVDNLVQALKGHFQKNCVNANELS